MAHSYTDRDDIIYIFDDDGVQVGSIVVQPGDPDIDKYIRSNMGLSDQETVTYNGEAPTPQSGP
jgi:hypothetical protein